MFVMPIFGVILTPRQLAEGGPATPPFLAPSQNLVGQKQVPAPPAAAKKRASTTPTARWYSRPTSHFCNPGRGIRCAR